MVKNRAVPLLAIWKMYYYPGQRMASLKLEHETRPLWISQDGNIILETFANVSQNDQEFISTIAEPISRPFYIHEFKITPYSLYAAISIGLDPHYIIKKLETLSKNIIPEDLKNFIIDSTANYNKVKLVLKNGAFWVETNSQDTFNVVGKDDIINSCKIKDDKPHLYSFQITPESVESFKKRCIELDYPVIEEYDYLKDEKNPNVSIELRASTIIRSYQEQSLSKMFSNGRVRSGIIVLPCGAGKTLVGIVAACTIKKSTLVLCTSAVAAEQWRTQFRQFSTISNNSISRFTSDSKEKVSNI